MRIPNPIYDIVFHYLMEDEEVAKTIISSIIEEDILELHFLPKGHTMKLEDRPITVKTMDFSALIKNSDGNRKQVIIELQKAKFHTDILRFRQYLGRQYQKSQSFPTENGEKKSRLLPIINIYFLGHKLEHITSPIIKVKRRYTDMRTGEEIHEKEEFIECLTHDSFVVQIPFLRKNKKTDLERLLEIFDQSYREEDDQRLLHFPAEAYPKRFEQIIRRLQQAMSEDDLMDQMVMEEIYIRDFENTERRLAQMSKEIEKKDEALIQKEKIIAELQAKLGQ